MGDRVKLSDLLIKFRDIHEESQKEVAEQLDIPPPSLSFYENDRRIPPFQILIKLLDHYDARIVIETDLGEWEFDLDDEGDVELEEKPKGEEMGLLSGLDDTEKEDLIAYIRRRRRHNE